MNFFLAWWVVSNQQRTNDILEQIRRLQLTPAQRAQEDTERLRRRARDNKIAGAAVAAAIVVLLLMILVGPTN